MKLHDVIPMQRLKEESWNLIGVSKGGLDLCHRIRGNLKNNIDFIFSEAIMAPNNPECEIARVSEHEEIVLNEKLIDAFEIQYDYIYGEANRKHEEDILSYVYQYRKGRHFPSMKDKVVMLTDEGSETGSKFMTALKTILNMQPRAVYIAVALLPRDVLELLEPYVDDIYFIHDIEDYVETSLYYKEFEDIKEEMIEKLLEESK